MKYKILNLKNEIARGFTLIELLIVIAIIGILMAFLTANYIGVRQRSRDAQRKSDVGQIKTALEFYRNDNDSYPTTATFPACDSAFVGTGATPPTYMTKIPCDPSSGTSYSYVSCDTAPCTAYTLVSCIENTGDLSAVNSSPNVGFSCTPTKYYVLTNP